ncbi:Phospholipase D Active site motif domain protein [Halorubrum coriense DSM 10284]|uniref:Phospholipase D Active site motif domain protein n=1 Tax=Halorubrum coriense DSM 10284 TaxID=1227466 RepID=M0EAD4_9EURY|nr:phosphatidylserine/phosphatidylglycerophosphate/cardiolipin synthase family protein [Halorubrum coriense]ELZ43374.1 Phospholipase D Active site motif domain protein [Halorubrum coriense DSM 10284]
MVKSRDPSPETDPDFTIADALSSTLIREIRRYFCEQHDASERVQTNRVELNDAIEERLGQRQAEALWVGLSANDAAEEVAKGTSYVEYDFLIDIAAALTVLNEQLVAARYREKRHTRPADEVNLVATIPDGVSLPNAEAVSQTAGRVRDLVLGAEETVRLANPYFDSEESILDDLASLPKRGVDTRILTRETSDPDPQLTRSLNKIYRLSADGRDRLEVRDLYERDEQTGFQQLATHAKIVIVDDSYCYVGSANLTRHSLSNNFEFGLLVKGDSVGGVVSVFDNVFEHATSVDLPLLTES